MNGDTGVPDTADAMRRMTEMKDSGVDAFVGLEHSCASEAFLATAWEVPLISYVSHTISHFLALFLPPEEEEKT